MNKSLFIAFFIVALTGSLFADEKAKPAAEKQLSFKEYAEHLMLPKNTSLHVKNFWAKTKSKIYTWKGKVVDVKGGRGKAEIHVANGESPLSKGYNIILVTYHMDKAAALKVGQEIKFEGPVYTYKGRRGNPIIVHMNNVELLPLDAK